MGSLRITLVAIAAVLLVGCGSGPATEPATGGAKNVGKTFGAAAKPGGTDTNVPAQANTVQLGPGAVNADQRVGSKVK